jgi:hypothetical protein
MKADLSNERMGRAFCNAKPDAERVLLVVAQDDREHVQLNWVWKKKARRFCNDGKGRRHRLSVGTIHRVGPPQPLQRKSLTGDASIGLLNGVMSPSWLIIVWLVAIGGLTDIETRWTWKSR